MSTPVVERRVSNLELFFDLVFVFGITQITSYFAGDHTALGFLEGGLLLLLLWWAWSGYTWLGTTVDVGNGPVRWAMFAAMAGLLVVALGLPEWFHDAQAGFFAPVVVALAYGVVRIAHVVLFWLTGRGEPALVRAVRRFAVSTGISIGLLLLAAFLGGRSQVFLVGLAVLLDYLGPLLGRGSGWIVSPSHFAERHGLIVIIALGESIVAIGVGAAGLSLSWPIVLAAVLGVAVAARIWVLYFDPYATDLEHQLCRRSGAAMAEFARDAYSFLHVFLVGGIILVALGLKTAIAKAGEYGLGAHLPFYAGGALFVGIALIFVMRQLTFLRAGCALEKRTYAGLAVAVVLVPLSTHLVVPAVLLAALGTLLIGGPDRRSAAA